MRILHLILSVLSLLMVGSTLICGFWIHNTKNIPDIVSSVNFHMMLAVVTGVIVLATTVLAFIRK